MQAVLLHDRGVQRDPLEEKGYEAYVMCCSQCGKNLLEGGGVAGAVVGRQLHAEQEHFGPVLSAQLDHFPELGTQASQVQAAQAVIRAQLDDAQSGWVPGQQSWQARQPAAAGFTADRGIDHPPGGRVFPETLFQQADPALFLLNAVCRAQTVAEHQDGGSSPDRGPGRQVQ